MSTRGFTSKEILLGIVVILLSAAVLYPVTLSMRSKDSSDRDIERMRRLYMAIAAYESDIDGYLPPTLDTARSYVPDDLIYLSTKDPFAESPKADSYPVDAGLPEWSIKASSRVSYTYLYSYQTAKVARFLPWYELKYEPKVGLIANEWQGEVNPQGQWQATVSGTLLRLNTDGALDRLERTETKPLGDFQSLFSVESEPLDEDPPSG